MVAAISPKQTRTKKKIRKANLLKLCSIMNKESADAVDKEITKRFKIFIDTSDEDITKVKLNAILKQPENINLEDFSEGLQPYIKHYLFMAKRKNR